MCPCLLVFDVVGSISEGLTTRLTPVRFLPRVNSNVSFKPERVWKEFIANVALVLPLGWLISAIAAVLTC